MRVLVVDDDRIALNAAHRLLASMGCDVVGVTRPWESFAHLGSVDVLITDQQMPVMTGLQLIDQVRRFHPSVGVVLTSADPSLAVPDGIRFVRKPWTREAIRGALIDVGRGPVGVSARRGRGIA